MRELVIRVTGAVALVVVVTALSILAGMFTLRLHDLDIILGELRTGWQQQAVNALLARQESIDALAAASSLSRQRSSTSWRRCSMRTPPTNHYQAAERI